MKHYYFILGLMLLVVTGLHAQEVSIGGEYRINPVYSRGFREPLYEGDKAGFYTMQRTRLIINYEKQDDLSAEVIIQDRRFWGDQDDRADVPNMALYRGWVEKQFTPKVSLRLGRQGFVYDEQHILGDPNWVGTRAHDAGLFKVETDSFKLHVAFAYNANGQELKREVYDYQNMYKTMQFVWAEKMFGRSKASFIVMNRGMEKGDTSSVFMQTFGPFVDIKLSDKLSFKGLYYYQVGENVSGQDVNAYFYSAQVTFKPSKVLSLTAGVDAGSGTNQTDYENPANKKSTTFDRQYGLLHGHFGYMDYFYVTQPTPVGVQDFYVKAKVNITDKFSIENHLHDFETSALLSNTADGTTMKPHLGIENDFMVNYKFSSVFNAQFAYCQMFGTSTLDAFFGGQDSQANQVFYAVITATPNFFKSKLEQKK